ncbi:MAG TPA: hypothetical protein VKL99_04595 [Candidatus Angelobacter sp.]|nr:hypothetical protein [Candidatus Angelobacter sp.]
MALLLSNIMPGLIAELEQLLLEANEPALSAQVRELRIVERCRCGDDFCATFYTEPRPKGSYGTGHRNIELNPQVGMIILDVVGPKIACVEILYRDEIQKALHAALP